MVVSICFPRRTILKEFILCIFLAAGLYFPVLLVEKAIHACIGQVENSVVAALGNTLSQESNTRRGNFLLNYFCIS